MSLPDLYLKLKDLYNDPIVNVKAIQDLKAEIDEAARREEAEKLKQANKESGSDKARDDTPTPRDFFKSQKDKEEYYANKQATKELPALHEPIINEKTGQTHTRPVTEYEERALRANIAGNPKLWYNLTQVETYGIVNNGPAELASFLKENKALIESGKSVVFNQIICNMAGDNHLTTFKFQKQANGKIEALYVDPNGEKIMPKELAAIESAFGKNTDIKYIDGVAQAKGEYKTISHAEVLKNPNKEFEIYRCQFDGHNCGMYGIEMNRMLTAANENELALVRGLKTIKNIEPADQRRKHANEMQEKIRGGYINKNAGYEPTAEEKNLSAAKKEAGKLKFAICKEETSKPSFAANIKNNGPAISA